MMRILPKIQMVCFVLWLGVTGCKETLGPQPVRQGVAPAPVTDYSSESIPGGAIITYKLPSGADLRYIKATYTLNTGVVREAKSTIYKNTIMVDGFSKAGAYDIKLTAVAVGEVESAATTVRITALTSPHQVVVDSIKLHDHMYATFGGINVDYQNSTEGSLVIRVMVKDANKNWAVAETAYTKARSGRIRLRGYGPVAREFGLFITDRWNNKSDTLVRLLTPLNEIAFNKALFKAVELPGDTYLPHPGASRARPMPVLWDGIINSGVIFHTQPVSVMPQWFTWDMGVKAKLSRFVFYPDANSNAVMFGPGQPSVWELWGSNGFNTDGSFDSWTKVGVFRSVKPSGLPLGQLSDDDVQQCLKGEEFEVEPGAGAFRYWRWKTLETWGNLSYMYMSEFSFFGEEEK